MMSIHIVERMAFETRTLWMLFAFLQPNRL